MVDFNANDVKKVAEALLESWYYNDEWGRNAYYTCNHCYASVNQYRNEPSDIQHLPNCAVLIAKDLLTGL